MTPIVRPTLDSAHHPAGSVGRPRREPIILGSAVVVAVLIGPAAFVWGWLVVVGLGAAALFVAVVAEPVRAGYAFLALTPLLGGFERGALLPVVRPTEALLLLLVGAVASNVLAGGLVGRLPVYRFSRLDAPIAAMAILSSVVPALWRVGRGLGLALDDLLYATTLWKYLLVFALFRLVVRTRHQVDRCLRIMLGTGVIVAVVAILQSLQLADVPQLIAAVYDEPLRAISNNRGTSTIGNSHAVADVMGINLAIAFGYLLEGDGRRRGPIALIGLFGLATLASGQFSAVFALATVLVVMGWLTGRARQTAALAIPATAAALVLLRPVIRARFDDVDASGVPSSWGARMFNLRTYFWPELRADYNYILGVRPAGRLVAPEPWRDFVFIESGHTWLLWTGGIPFFAAWLWFTVVAIAVSHAVITGFRGPLRVAGIGAINAVAIVFVLMSFDVHLTMRGTADALFPLLAMCTVIVSGAIADGAGSGSPSRAGLGLA